MRILGFQRGGDVMKTLGIGTIALLKDNIKKLENHNAVAHLFCGEDNAISVHGISTGMKLSMNLDLSRTNCGSPDEFLIEYLAPKYFSRVNIERDNCEMGMDEDLGRLRRNTNKFSVHMEIAKEWQESFPKVGYW